MIAPFELPLSREEFKGAMELGHGRALLHARKYGLAEYRDDFLTACLSNLVFDTQYEDSRTRWLGEFFDGAPPWLLLPLLDSYRRSEVLRDLSQMAELLGLMAERGSEEAKRALYEGFRKTDWGWLGEDELLGIDGASALVWMAERLGSFSALERYEIELVLSSYDALTGDGEGLKVLSGVSKESVRRAVKLATEPRPRAGGPKRKSKRLKDYTGKEIVEAAQGNELIGFPRMWGYKADPEQLAFVADALKSTEEPRTLQSLLRCFQRNGLPEFWEGLLKLANHEVQDIRWLTYWVLRHHQHPSVRTLALGRLEENQTTEGEFKLFQSNYEKGDAKRILAALRRLPTDDSCLYHWALGDVLEVALANPVKENLALLMFVYEKTPCTNCRQKAVLEMMRRRDVPKWALDECRFDCDLELRGKQR